MSTTTTRDWQAVYEGISSIIIHYHHHHLMDLDDERSIHRRILATGHLGTSHSPSREHPHISS